MDFRQIPATTLHRISFVILTICVLTEQFNLTTSEPNFVADCVADGSLLITGDVISISEVIESVECWRNANRINIFALNKVIFDNDIDKRHVLTVNMTIFAPTWEIQPPPPSASETENQTQRRVLLNANVEFHFVGVCAEKINGERLRFDVEGDESRVRTMINNGSHFN